MDFNLTINFRLLYADVIYKSNGNHISKTSNRCAKRESNEYITKESQPIVREESKIEKKIE